MPIRFDFHSHHFMHFERWMCVFKCAHKCIHDMCVCLSYKKFLQIFCFFSSQYSYAVCRSLIHMREKNLQVFRKLRVKRKKRRIAQMYKMRLSVSKMIPRQFLSMFLINIRFSFWLLLCLSFIFLFTCELHLRLMILCRWRLFIGDVRQTSKGFKTV